jgi:hypothetical protein
MGLSQSATLARTDYPFLGDQATGDFNGHRQRSRMDLRYADALEQAARVVH